MSYSYKLRITLEESGMSTSVYNNRLLKCREMEERYFSSYVRCLETGKDTGKTHYHYFCITVNQNPLRQFIQKYIGKGNGIYSLKRLDEEYPIEYLSYIVKEDTNAVWCNMPDDIKENTKAYASEIRKKISTTRKEGRITKLRKMLIEKFGCIPINKEQLVSEIVEIYIQERWVINHFHIINNATTLLVEESEDFKKKFIQNILEKIN